MPTYDYRCDTCEHTFELFQSFAEDPLSTCTIEVCNGPGNGTVRKIFSAPGISFKGSGFYKNDSSVEINVIIVIIVVIVHPSPNQLVPIPLFQTRKLKIQAQVLQKALLTETRSTQWKSELWLRCQ